jgi:5'-nucleotidase/UDP-sugar diphosphatase
MKFAGFVASALAATANAQTKLTLLHINDHHSHLSESSAGYINIFGSDIPSAVSTNNGGTTYVRAYYGGMPRLVTAFNELQDTAESNGRDVLRLHAGDAITGTTFFTLFEGDADAKLMSHLCFDAFAPGNHEFDKGDAGLAKFLVALKDTATANTSCGSMPAVLGANIVPHANSPILAAGVPEIEKSRVYDLPSGGKVGIVGIDVRGKTMNSSNPDVGTILLDEKETAQAEIDALTSAGVNMIVLLTHIGYSNDLNWLAELNGVDVIVGGDSHSLLGDESTAIFGTTRGPYATEVIQANGSKVCVVQAWDYSKVIGNLEVDFDADGNVMQCGGNPVFPFNPSKITVRDANPRYDMSAEDAEVVMAHLSSMSNGQAQTFEENAQAAADLAVFSAEVEILSQTVVAQSSTYIPLEAGGYASGACDLVAQGFLMNPLSTADVAIQNRGGCRSSIQQVRSKNHRNEFSIFQILCLLTFNHLIFYYLIFLFTVFVVTSSPIGRVYC